MLCQLHALFSQSVSVQRLVTRHLQPVLLQLRLLLHLQHAKKGDGIWVRQVRTQQRPAHGGYIRFAYCFAESAVKNIKNSTRSRCEENKTANRLLSVKGQ